MQRWSQTIAEAMHIAKLKDDVPIFGIVHVRLNSGIEFYGVIRSASAGNNASQTFPPTAYYFDITFQLEDKSTQTISLIDIEWIRDAWAVKSIEFAELGLIKI